MLVFLECQIYVCVIKPIQYSGTDEDVVLLSIRTTRICGVVAEFPKTESRVDRLLSILPACFGRLGFGI